MNLINQQKVIPELAKLAESRRHNVLISGTEGCGKTYLARLYAKQLGIEDFIIAESKVSSVKEAIDTCMNLHTPIVLCIENLDLGVNAVSYAILKFLEEPSENVYIVVTCRNVKGIPDTILSRCVSLTLSPMAKTDILLYAKEQNAVQFAQVYKDRVLWECVKSIGDADKVLGLTALQISYFKNLQSLLNGKSTVSDIIWKLQKFPDGTAAPIEITIRYLMYSIKSSVVFTACHKCLTALSNGKIGTHAILARFVFELKYT
ncbi:MAG: AAA family ATPase [Clostridium sp.]|nr:AAA family ATPase [Clostridium sp.]